MRAARRGALNQLVPEFVEKARRGLIPGAPRYLVIDTTSTIIIFLKVFLMQNMRNRDTLAMHFERDDR